MFLPTIRPQSAPRDRDMPGAKIKNSRNQYSVQIYCSLDLYIFISKCLYPENAKKLFIFFKICNNDLCFILYFLYYIIFFISENSNVVETGMNYCR